MVRHTSVTWLVFPLLLRNTAPHMRAPGRAGLQRRRRRGGRFVCVCACDIKQRRSDIGLQDTLSFSVRTLAPVGAPGLSDRCVTWRKGSLLNNVLGEVTWRERAFWEGELQHRSMRVDVLRRALTRAPNKEERETNRQRAAGS